MVAAPESESVPAVNGKVNGAVKIKSKNQLRRLKAKQKKVEDAGKEELTISFQSPAPGKENSVTANGPISEIEYVLEDLNLADPTFSDVFKRFVAPVEEDVKATTDKPSKGEIIYSDDEQASDHEDDEEAKPLSKKKARKINRLSVAALKSLVRKPEIVEWTDPSSPDPLLLLHLKSSRNSVPIPAHWSAKRDYLQSKRGIEKPPFQLPSYIADTGIATLRDAVKEKEGNMTLKAKTRERVQGKVGRGGEVDYQKLHDAFFKYCKPEKGSGFGEMYYEGKEFETQLKEKRPGDLSPELVEALSIPPLAPPPWLISMQRFGPPPSYPTLRIPGLNAPIPEGAQWGFHPGGWGKPPLDEYNRPLYGDVFGVVPRAGGGEMGEPIDKSTWGELEPEEEESESEEEESEEESDDDGAKDRSGTQTPSRDMSGVETPSGMASVVSSIAGGLETPDFIELRKRPTSSVDDGPKSLYQVLPEKQTNVRGMMGSERGYDVSKVAGGLPVLGDERGTKRKASAVDLSIDAAELEGMSEDELRRRYEQASSKSSAGVPGSKEDFSDMVAKEMAKKKQKMDKDKDRKSGRGGDDDSKKEPRERRYKF
ncbi:hypothetical protein C8J56DRAFT_788387 [Mycena floridula]|nr:hypothetical protein C8J56DRAFT_788387 [Mycena floridula]